LDDVKPEITTEEALPQAEETAEQTSQPVEQTQNTEATPSVEIPSQPKGDLTVALRKERERVRELQRQIAEKESSEAMSQYDPQDLDSILQHPYVQDLIIKQARQELTDYAREALDQYPNLHPQVKKAILKNARGFVNETTTDVETAKLDLQEYIESIAEEAVAEPQAEQAPEPSKGFKVANTNVPSTEPSGVKLAEIQNILAKPVDSWTADEEAAVEEYRKRNPIK
jgi:hypothetical protein